MWLTWGNRKLPQASSGSIVHSPAPVFVSSEAGIGQAGMPVTSPAAVVCMSDHVPLAPPFPCHAETTYPAALVLFDEEGNVIERLPR